MRTWTYTQTAPQTVSLVPTALLWLRRPPRLYLPRPSSLWALHAPLLGDDSLLQLPTKHGTLWGAPGLARAEVTSVPHTATCMNQKPTASDALHYALVDLSSRSTPSPSAGHSSPQLTHPPLDTPRIEPLSAREREILQTIAAGFSNKAIAQTLGISIGTVKWHIANLYSKLGVHSRTQAVASGHALGVVAPHNSLIDWTHPFDR